MNKHFTYFAGMACVAGVALGSMAWMARAQTAGGDAATIEALKASVAAMERRVQRLRDVDEIENLVSAYGYYLDKALWDQLADLFAEEGTIEIAQRGVYKGRESIRRSLELYGPEPLRDGHLHNHIQVQPVIHISEDGQTAHVRSRAISQLGTHGQVGVWGDGVYENTFVKQDGVWKILHDHVYTTFFSTYDEGFVDGARPAPGPSTDIPPDAPPSVVYQSFPGVYVPPFHYNNPGSGTPIEIPPVRGVPEEAGQ